MTKFIKKGDTFYLTSNENLIVTEHLPVGTYTICYDQMQGFYLKQIDDYEAPIKLYGDVLKRADRILNTFIDRKGATGVLLSGEKGCGKSMLAKLLSVKGAEKKFPTIVINQNWHGEVFNSFIQAIHQPTIILFDEFEKIYHEKEAQEAMLTLLDGVYPTNKLFILTTNDKYGINQHMLNRPGRLFYNIEYSGLSEEFIKEYCEDRLKDKTQIKSICSYKHAFSSFNFDMLQALIEEMNRYGESLQEAISLLNIKAESYQQHFLVKFTINGKVPYWHSGESNENLLVVNPHEYIYINYSHTKKQMDEGEEIEVRISPSDLRCIKNNTYIYEGIIGKYPYKLVLTKHQKNVVDYNKMYLVA